MRLFCSMMHFASGRVRRKTFSLCYKNVAFSENTHLTERATVKIASVLKFSHFLQIFLTFTKIVGIINPILAIIRKFIAFLFDTHKNYGYY